MCACPLVCHSLDGPAEAAAAAARNAPPSPPRQSPAFDVPFSSSLNRACYLPQSKILGHQWWYASPYDFTGPEPQLR